MMVIEILYLKINIISFANGELYRIDKYQKIKG